MDYREYLSKFNANAISLKFLQMQHNRTISSAYREHLLKLMSRASNTSDSQINVFKNTTVEDIRYIILYECVKLDLQNFHFVKNTRNVRLNAMEFTKALSTLDVDMVTIPDMEALRSVTTIMVCMTILQCVELRKVVEVQSMLRRICDLDRIKLRKAFWDAQELFNDNSHFCKLDDSDSIVRWMNPVSTTPKHSKAF